MTVSERALVSKLAEIEVRVLLPLGEGLEIGHLRNEGWTFWKGVLGEKSSRRPFAPPSRRGTARAQARGNACREAASPGRRCVQHQPEPRACSRGYGLNPLRRHVGCALRRHAAQPG